MEKHKLIAAEALEAAGRENAIVACQLETETEVVMNGDAVTAFQLAADASNHWRAAAKLVGMASVEFENLGLDAAAKRCRMAFESYERNGVRNG